MHANEFWVQRCTLSQIYTMPEYKQVFLSQLNGYIRSIIHNKNLKIHCMKLIHNAGKGDRAFIIDRQHDCNGWVV